jgi:hypothetical protein
VGPRTFSSGEALAHHLRARGQVTVVDSVTGTNWEGAPYPTS